MVKALMNIASKKGRLEGMKDVLATGAMSCHSVTDSTAVSNIRHELDEVIRTVSEVQDSLNAALARLATAESQITSLQQNR